MAGNADIILGIRPVDVAGSIMSGAQSADAVNAMRQQNALTELYRTQGPGIAAGDPGAINALARFSPEAALGVQNTQLGMQNTRLGMQRTQQGMEFDREAMKLQYQEANMKAREYAAGLDAATREAEAEKLEQAIRAGAMAETPQQWDALVSQFGAPELAGQFENRVPILAQVAGVADALKVREAMQPQRPDPLKGAPSGYMFTDPSNPAAGVAPLPGFTPKAGVEVNLGGGKFEEEFAKTDAQALAEASNAGIAARRNMGRIDQLDRLLAASPSGLTAIAKQAAGEWGINTEGLDNLQSAQAMINSLVPEQRQPGSGPMSDADLALFKASLPRLINQPGGNATIIATIKAIAEYDAQGAEIVQRARSGQIDRATAFQELQNRPNPLAQFGGVSAQPAPQVSPAQPAPQVSHGAQRGAQRGNTPPAAPQGGQTRGNTPPAATQAPQGGPQPGNLSDDDLLRMYGG